MKVREVICCATCPSSSALGLGSVTLYDLQTGAQVASFKQTSATPHSTAIVQTSKGHGGLILAAQPEKAILNVYLFQKEQLHLRIVLPEKLSCIATDPEGRYCAAGTSAGRIYLWEIASGIMFNSFEAHYRSVDVLKFTLDGAALISGSEDSRVAVWAMARLLDNDLQHEIPLPFCTLADHTLPVTDICCGVGPFPSCRVLTSSLDNSCKLWDISTNTLLSTFLFPQPVTAIAFDPAERTFFAASKDGSIHQVNLFRQRRDTLGRSTGGIEAVGGTGDGDAIRITAEEGPNRSRLITSSQEVTSIAISLTGSSLLVGTANGLVQIYDIASHQLLRTINTHQGFAVTHVSSFVKPPDLVGQITLGSTGTSDAIPARPVASFQRVRDASLREAHDVPVILPISLGTSVIPSKLPPYDFAEDHRFFTNQIGSTASAQVLQTRVAELEAELASMKQNLSKAKGLNDAMWEAVVSNVLTPAEEVGQARKRAKVNGK